MPRSSQSKSTHAPAFSPSQIRVGFIALNDAAPLVVAHETGIFTRFGLKVELSRELGWASVRDKIAYGELEASQAISTSLISTRLGLDGPPCECLTGCILNNGGNAITLSERLWEHGVRDASTLHDEIVRTRHERPIVLGVATRRSTHELHLNAWLESGGINPRRDVRVVVVPPPQVFRNLLAGTIDGYCVGEPWNSLAIQHGMGWCPATSHDIHPGHPEKVLMVTTRFAHERHDEHLALIAALIEAGRQCDDPTFRPELVKLLARREYLNVASEVIAAGLVGPFAYGHDRAASADHLVSFYRDAVNEPTLERAEWLIEACRRHGLLLPETELPRHLARDLFRADLHQQACQRHHLTNDHEVSQPSS